MCHIGSNLALLILAYGATRLEEYMDFDSDGKMEDPGGKIKGFWQDIESRIGTYLETHDLIENDTTVSSLLRQSKEVLGFLLNADDSDESMITKMTFEEEVQALRREVSKTGCVKKIGRSLNPDKLESS